MVKDSDEVFENIMNNSSTIRYEVGKILGHQFVNSLFQFYIDDSFDYSKKIDALLNANENSLQILIKYPSKTPPYKIELRI